MSRPCRACGSPDHDACGPPRFETTRTGEAMTAAKAPVAWRVTPRQLPSRVRFVGQPPYAIADIIDPLALHSDYLAERERAETSGSQVNELLRQREALTERAEEAERDSRVPEATARTFAELLVAMRAENATLTRERDEARQLLDKMAAAKDRSDTAFQDVSAERDEARAQRDRVVAEATFLLARLVDIDNGDTFTGAGWRDFHGHVRPPMARLDQLLCSIAQDNAEPTP